MLGGAIKQLVSTKHESEYKVANIPWTPCLPPIKLGPLEKEGSKLKYTKSLERGVLPPQLMRQFSDDPIYRTRSCPDASNLKGLTDDLDDALADMLTISENAKNPGMYQSKPSIQIQDDPSENDESDGSNDGEEPLKGEQNFMGNPLNDKRQL